MTLGSDSRPENPLAGNAPRLAPLPIYGRPTFRIGHQHVPLTETVSGIREYAPATYGPLIPLIEKLPLEASAEYTVLPVPFKIAKATEIPVEVDHVPEIETQFEAIDE